MTALLLSRPCIFLFFCFKRDERERLRRHEGVRIGGKGGGEWRIEGGGEERERKREREEVAALERHASPLLFSFLAPLSCLFKATFGGFQSSRGPNRSRSISLEAKEEKFAP